MRDQHGRIEWGVRNVAGAHVLVHNEEEARHLVETDPEICVAVIRRTISEWELVE